MDQAKAHALLPNDHHLRHVNVPVILRQLNVPGKLRCADPLLNNRQVAGQLLLLNRFAILNNLRATLRHG